MLLPFCTLVLAGASASVSCRVLRPMQHNKGASIAHMFNSTFEFA